MIIETTISILLYGLFGVYLGYHRIKEEKDSELPIQLKLNTYILIHCALRVVSFTIWLLLQNVYPMATTIDDGMTSLSSFLQKCEILAINFPDFFFLSVYMLLLMVWIEGSLSSRRHWLGRRYQHTWNMAYTLFNVIIYALQFSLYSLLWDQSITSAAFFKIIFFATGTMNILLVIGNTFAFLFLFIELSGFPFSSDVAAERAITLGFKYDFFLTLYYTNLL